MSVIQLSFEDGLTEAALDRLTAGDSVELSGRVISLRDASAARLARALSNGERLPVSLLSQQAVVSGKWQLEPLEGLCTVHTGRYRA